MQSIKGIIKTESAPVYGKINYIVKDQHEIIEELQKQIVELKNQVSQLDLQIIELQQEKQELQNQVERLTGEVNQLTTQIVFLQGQIVLLQQQKAQLESQVVALQERIDQLQAQVSLIDTFYLPYIQGTATEFVSNTITSLRPYAFYNDQNITKIYLPNLQSIPDNCFGVNQNLLIADIPWNTNIAFYQCYNLNPCKKYSGEIVEKVLLGNVRSNAFGYCGQSIIGSEEMSFIGNNTIVSSGGFLYSGISKLTGSFKHIESNAFAHCNRLQYVSITVGGYMSSDIFKDCKNVTHFYINPQSVITQLGFGDFENLGLDRESPQNNIFEMDLQNSIFREIPQRCYSYCKYFDVYFPSTVNSIDTFAFQQCSYCALKFNSLNPPSVSTSTAFETLKNSKIFVPIDSLDAYKTATNWSVQAASIYPWKHYTAGDTLDSNYNWYSDIRLTNQVTGTAPETADYYGVAI